MHYRPPQLWNERRHITKPWRHLPPENFVSSYSKELPSTSLILETFFFLRAVLKIINTGPKWSKWTNFDSVAFFRHSNDFYAKRMKKNSCSLSYYKPFFVPCFLISLTLNFYTSALDFLSIIRTSLSLSLWFMQFSVNSSHCELHFLFFFFLFVSLVETGRNNYFHFVLFSSFHHLLSAPHLSFNFRTSESRFFVSMDVVRFCSVWTTDLSPAIIVFLEFLSLRFPLIFHFLVPWRKAIFFSEWVTLSRFISFLLANKCLEEFCWFVSPLFIFYHAILQ